MVPSGHLGDEGLFDLITGVVKWPPSIVVLPEALEDMTKG